MRIDNSNTAEIRKVNTIVERKGRESILPEDGAAGKVDAASKKTYGIRQATVEKALFSMDKLSTDSELEKLKQAADNIDVKQLKNHLAVLSNTVSKEDLRKMQEEGFSLNDTQIETIVTVMDKIKMELAKAGVDINVFGDSLEIEQLEHMAGSKALARQMAQALKNADLPASTQNHTDMVLAWEKEQSLTKCGDGDIKYLLDNELEPTIDNLYKAQHSGSAGRGSGTSEWTQDEKLNAQIEQVVKAAGLPVNEKTVGYGRFMLANEIPLTPENLQYMDWLKELQFPLENENVIRAMTDAIAEGKRPGDAILIDCYSLKDRAGTSMEVVRDADERDLAYIIRQRLPLSIENLKQAKNYRKVPEEKGSDESLKQPMAPKDDIRLIAGRRQLEETRLFMTVQANYALLKRGIAIETEELEQVVEQLKSMEENYYQTLLQQNGIEPTTENTELFAETTRKTESIKDMPALSLGRHYYEPATINALYESGAQVKALMDQAGQAYETMMTAPRADLGDSIQKAFRNTDDILNSLGLNNGQANQRAVRMLGYNGLEITEESITRMKGADQKVQNLLRNMTPSVVMEIIKEGINPLETDLDTLNAKAEEMIGKLDVGQEEKFSKYLWELEQKQGITPEEKESYIGIYRLLHQIEKTDGAVIGALVNQGNELSLKNLLHAVRNRKARGMDINIDENFGTLQEVKPKEASITQQIEAAYQTDCAKEAFSRMTQEGMEQALATDEWQEMTPEQLLWQIKEAQVQEENQKSWYQEQQKLFADCQQTEELVIKMLDEYDMPVTTYNMLAVGHMVNNRNGIFRQLFDPKKLKESPNLEEVKQKILEDFAEAVKTPEDMAKAQEALADTAENVMETMLESETIHSLDVRNLKILRQEIQLSTKMSKEENYAIPVLVGDELTNVQLKIVRGKKEKGRVDILFETESLGKVAARLQAEAEAISGYVAADKGATLQSLEGQDRNLKEMLGRSGEYQIDLQYIRSDTINIPELFTKGAGGNQAGDSSQESITLQTRQLYGIARNFLSIIKTTLI